MTSKLRITTLANQDDTKSVPANTVINGSAKAWVNFNGTGTISIRANFNVSSITDGGPGVYTVNFTNAMPDTNYSTTATCSRDNNSGYSCFVAHMDQDNIWTTGVLIRTGYGATTVLDSPRVCVAVFR